MNRIYLAGVDMIGDFITEINITSPTGIQEIERECKNNLSKDIANQFINIAQSFYNHDY
jgi:glutathione synthase